ncbi:carboxylating nicotinate-nucleotide diphosphorylase [candidate division WOR-3 bacterium]|nr:carboxylating nicotinate-nucleotide diphosphorylase [candidate division WOR-3 bacterium]
MANGVKCWTDDYHLIAALALCEDLSASCYDCFAEFLKTGKVRGSDVTTDAIFQNEKSEAVVISKSKGVLSGTKIFKLVYELIDEEVKAKFLKNDSDSLEIGDEICRISGRMSSILKGERTALNFIGHLSGIATEVNNLLKELSDVKITLIDTRKTTPGMRRLEKEAVTHGGAQNHRFGLYDMVLIKDNHIDAAGSIKNAVEKVRKKYGNLYKIEVETRNISEVKEALEQRVDRIMLDNMSRNEIEKALELIDDRIEVEVSGNMDAEKIKNLKGLNIDYVSLGYITASVKSHDFSMVIRRK